MKKKVLFFCRYSFTRDSKNLTFPSSIAAERKIDGICDSLTGAHFIPVLVLTPLSPPQFLWQSASVFKYKNRVCIVPYAINIFGSKILSYIVNILLSAFFIASMRRHKTFFSSMIYNMMPDTSIPALALRLFNKNHIQIFDFEEEISNDYEAPKLFRLFDSYFRKKLSFDAALLSSSKLNKSVRAKKYELFHGFTTADEIKAADEAIAKSKSFQNEISNYRELNISFIGRLDNMRCISEFLVAIETLAHKHKDISVTVVGYCNDQELLNHIKYEIKRIKNLIPISLSLSVPRHEVVKALVESDICISLVKDTSFLERSFPSKLVEYLLFDCVVVSQFIYDLQNVDNFVWIQEASSVEILAGLEKAIIKSKNIDKKSFNGRAWVQSNCTPDSGSKRLTKLFYDISKFK